MRIDFDRNKFDERGWALFEILLFLYALFINFYLITVYTCKDCVAVVGQANYFAPWLLLLSVLFFAMSFLKSRRLWLWMLPGVIFFALWYGPKFVPPQSKAAENLELNAMTWNVLEDRDHDEKIPGVLKDIKADIVMMQEFTPEIRDEIEADAELIEMYPYREYFLPGRDYEGMAVLSRYEILDVHVEENPDYNPDIWMDGTFYMRVEMDIAGTQVAVYNFHPPLPEMKPLVEYDDSYNLNHVNQFLEAAQAETIPVMMLCDCNIPPLSESYAILDNHLDEAHGEQGWSFGTTFMGMPENAMGLTRIDYIWYDDNFEPLEVEVIDHNAESDHMPVFVRFDLDVPEVELGEN